MGESWLSGPKDYRGICAVILSLGTVVALIAIICQDSKSSGIDTTLMATIFGGILGVLGSYVGSALPQRHVKDTNDGEEVS